MNNGSIKWDTFWDVQRFFIVNGETIKYQFGTEFITGTDEQGNEIKNLVRPAAKGEFPRPELAKSDAQFEEILARELAREKINDPSVSISEVLSELDLAMVFFNDVLIRASLENINEQAYKEMKRIVSRFTNFIKSKNSKPIDDAERHSTGNELNADQAIRIHHHGFSDPAVIAFNQALGNFFEGVSFFDATAENKAVFTKPASYLGRVVSLLLDKGHIVGNDKNTLSAYIVHRVNFKTKNGIGPKSIETIVGYFKPYKRQNPTILSILKPIINLPSVSKSQ